MNWDQYFHNVCVAVSRRSKCFSRQIGAIVVRDHSILATGYNGPPRGVPHCGLQRFETDAYLRDRLQRPSVDPPIPTAAIATRCPRQLLGYESGGGLELCIAAHAERNTLINCAREGVAVKGASIYMNCGVPCKDCLVEIINAGIVEVVCESKELYDEESKFLIAHSHIFMRGFSDDG